MWPFDDIQATIDGFIALIQFPFVRVLELAYTDWCILYEPIAGLYNTVGGTFEFGKALINLIISGVFGLTIAGLILVSIGIAIATRLIRLIKKLVFQWF